MLTDEEEKRETIELVAYLEEGLNDYDEAIDFVVMAMGELKLDADGKPADGGLAHLHCIMIILRNYFKLVSYSHDRKGNCELSHDRLVILQGKVLS